MMLPVVAYAIAYIAGIVLADYLHIKIVVAAMLVAAGIICAFIAYARRSPLRIIAITVLFLLFGMLVTVLHISHVESGLIAKAAAEQSFVKISGTLATDPELKNDVSSFDLNIDRVSFSGPIDYQTYANGRNSSQAVELIANSQKNGYQTNSQTDWYVSERVRVRVRSDKPLNLTSGEDIYIEGRLEQPKTTGDFDYKRYLYHKDITAILTASEEVVKPPNEQKLSAVALSGAVRHWIKKVYLDNLPEDSAALLIGIVLGDDSEINDDLGESFRTTGLTHILAASGMNIALVLAALWPLLRYMRLKPPIQYAILVAFAGAYTLVSGMSPSLTRAFLMAAVGLTAWLSGRDKSGLASISAAALLLLILNPFTLFDIGFQLSFLATASLLIFVPIIDPMMGDLPRWLRSGLSVTVAAQIGVLPILVYYFGQVSVISVLANLIIVPLAEPALILGMVLLPFQAMLPVLAAPFYWILAADMGSVIYLTKLVSQTPGAAIVVEEPSIVAVAIMYASIVAFGIALSKASSKVRLQFGHIIILLIALMCASIWVTAFRSLAPSQLQVTFFDVGQGDSALLQTPDGVKVLIDTGPDFDVLKRKLDLRGVKRIDAVIISHTHADHAAGIKDIFNNYSVGSFYYPRSAQGEAAMFAMLKSAKQAGVRCVPVDNHDRAQFGEQLQMVSFCKGGGEAGGSGYSGLSGSSSSGGENEKCIVCLLRYGEFELMFTGDADEELEQEICDENCGDENGNVNSMSAGIENDGSTNKAIEADVLKVGHHGSRTSNSKMFLKQVDPEVSVISVGEHNKYGHPSSDAITRIRASQSKIYRTDKDGDVTIISDGNAFRVNTEHQ